MKILVTGAAGFIGSHLVDWLCKEGHEVTGLDDLSGGNIRNLGQLESRKRLIFVRGDCRNKDIVNKLMEGQDAVFHLAAYAAEGHSVFSPTEINDINIKSMNNLLVAAINHDVKRFIFTSSMAVYGNQNPPFDEEMPKIPEDPYGLGKAFCEDMLHLWHKLHGLDYVIIRPHNVYGERQNIADPYRNVIGIWMNMIMRNKRPFIYGDGEQTRAFSYVENVTPAIGRALNCQTNEIINVGSPNEITLNKLYENVAAAMETKLMPIYMEDRPGEVKHAYCTTGKSRTLLEYRETYSFEAGIMRMAKWAKMVGPQKPSYRIPLEIIKNAPTTWRERLI